MSTPAPKRVTRAAEALAAALDSDFLRALSEPVRVDILKHLIVHGESDIAAIAASVAPDRSVVSRHLKLMLDAGLLRVRKEGRHRFYDCNAVAFVAQLENILARTRALMTMCCPDQLDTGHVSDP